MKKLLGLLLLVGACATTTGAARTNVSTVGRAFHSTVTLETATGQVFCSGVIVESVVLTAWHCTDHDMPIYVGSKGSRWLASVRSTDRTNDLAVLTPVDGRSVGRGVKLARRAPSWATDIWVIGHPLGTYEYSITKGIVSHPDRANGIFGGRWFQHDAGTIGGNSGGPVLNERGQLVGIVSFGVLNGIYCVTSCPGAFQDTHLAGAVHLDPIRSILR
jgi:serine protease Do